jgi:hypothetical protein
MRYKMNKEAYGESSASSGVQMKASISSSSSFQEVLVGKLSSDLSWTEMIFPRPKTKNQLNIELKVLWKKMAHRTCDSAWIKRSMVPDWDRDQQVSGRYLWEDEQEDSWRFIATLLNKDLQSASQLSNLDQSNNTDQYSSEEQDDDETEGERCVPRQAQQVNRECYQFQKYDRYINSSCWTRFVR